MLFQLRQENITILLTEHVMRIAMVLAEKVVVLHHGKKISDGAPAVVASDPPVIESYLGRFVPGEPFVRNEVLVDLSMHVDEGETIAVLGGNGAGKTTLIRPIAGMVKASGGSVVSQMSRSAASAAIGSANWGWPEFPRGGSWTVEDNLRLGAILKRARGRMAQNLVRVFDLFPHLRERRGQLAGTVSGGEQQMVAIGRALMAAPRLIMLDEPPLGLALQMVEIMFETIAILARQGISILLVEQNAAESLRLASRAMCWKTERWCLRGAARL